MLDHVLLEFIAAFKGTLESAMLEKTAVEERLQIDIGLGDVTFETSYALPGEASPPRLHADISLEWPTWSQSAYRSWTLGDGLEDGADLDLEVAFRLHGAAQGVSLETLLGQLPHSSPRVFGTDFQLASVAIEESMELSELQRHRSGELIYQATLHFEESNFDESRDFLKTLEPLGAWITSILVKLDDSGLRHHDEDDA